MKHRFTVLTNVIKWVLLFMGVWLIYHLLIASDYIASKSFWMVMLMYLAMLFLFGVAAYWALGGFDKDS